MKRARVSVLIAASLLAALAVSADGARADYHPACLGIVTGNDTMSMSAASDGVTATGQVTCPGAQKIEIDLTVSGAGTGVFSAGCSDVAGCLNPLVASGTLDPVDGEYRLDMVFHVEGIGGVLVFDPAPRCGMWTVQGTTATGPTTCPA